MNQEEQSNTNNSDDLSYVYKGPWLRLTPEESKAKRPDWYKDTSNSGKSEIIQAYIKEMVHGLPDE